MIRKRSGFMVVVFFVSCLGLVLAGCAKKTVMKDTPSVSDAESAAERERAARLEAERAQKEKELAAEKERMARLEAERELREKELKAREEEAKRILAEKELAAERERAARLEAERTQREKELAAERERTAGLEAERELREKELKAREEEANRILAEKELAAERERAAKLELKEKELKAKEDEAKRALAEKRSQFEQSLESKKYPGIEGEVFESKLLKDISFNYDSYDLRSGDMEILNGNASLLREHPGVKIQIEGHCDERGTLEYNLALGERRANSIKKYLVSLGISEGRISTISFGKERPLDPNHNEQAWAKNRRGHFIVLSK